jgi:hypothetical protein
MPPAFLFPPVYGGTKGGSLLNDDAGQGKNEEPCRGEIGSGFILS